VAFKTQQEAIDRSRKNGHAPRVARVRHLIRQKETGPLAGGVSVTFLAEPVRRGSFVVADGGLYQC
jgi:hypothetical protein